MRYAFLVAWREYAENAKTKGFWIGIFLLPVILFLSIQVPIWLEKKATPTRYFVLVDQSGKFAEVVQSGLEKHHQRKVLEELNDYARKNATGPEASALLKEFNETNPQSVEKFISKGGKEFFLSQLRPHLKPGAPAFDGPRRAFQDVAAPAEISAASERESVAEALKPYLRGQRHLEVEGQPIDLSAAVLIPRDVEGGIVRPNRKPAANADPSTSTNSQIQFWSANASDPRLREEIERLVNNEVRRREYLARGMDGAAVKEVEQTYVPFTSLNPKKEKGKEAVSGADMVRQWAPSGFVYLLWMSIFVIIQMLLNNTIEEKSNRIIEVLLSSVTPGELMMGKLGGIAAIGLTMVGAWMLALFGILGWKAGGASEIAGHLLTTLKSSNLIPLFSVYFLLGYLMYAGIILSIGSVCNTIKEAQSYMGVLTMIMMVPLLTMTFIPKDPNGPLARVLSWIPCYTPFTMMNRAAADPPLVDLIGTLVLLLVTTALALWMSGKIFRIGVLRTGQPPKIIEMLRWVAKRD
jgi:ABC-2 type transport system permease protein